MVETKYAGILRSSRKDKTLAYADNICDPNLNQMQDTLNQLLKQGLQDISTLQSQTKQIKDTVDGIAVSGGASIASAVSYDNTESGLEAMNLQNAIDELVNSLGHYETNEEWIRLYLDAEGHILWGIKADGSIEWSVGIPTPIQKKLNELISSDDTIKQTIAELRDYTDKQLATKVDKEEGKSLISDEVKDSFEVTGSDEFIDLKKDAEDHILEAITADGEKQINLPTRVPSASINGAAEITAEDNKEWAYLIKDAEDHVLLGIQQDGSVEWSKGIPSPIRAKLNELISSNNSIKQTGAELMLDRNKDALKSIYGAKKSYDTSSQNNWYLTSSNSNLFCIAHGTDFHTDNIRMQNFMDFVDAVEEINVAVGTGDFVDSPSESEFALINSILPKNKDFLKVLGNHDVASNSFGLDKVKELMKMNSLYYYKDYTNYKVRIIVLNQYDVPSDTTVSSGNLWEVRDNTGHFTQGQIDWLLSTLDDAIINELNVIICMHSPEREVTPKEQTKKFYQRNHNWNSSISYISGPIIGDIVNAFKKGLTLEKIYTYQNENAEIPPVTVNHTFSGNGKFVCYIAGHLHSDFIGVSPDYEDQLYLVETCTCAIPQIANSRNYGEEVSDLPRIIGTSSEDAFNVYAFDFDKKQIKVVRIGSNINDQMEDRDKEIYNY